MRKAVIIGKQEMEGSFILIRWVNRSNGLRERNHWIDEMLKVQEKEIIGNVTEN